MRFPAAACLVFVSAVGACGRVDSGDRPSGAGAKPDTEPVVAVGFVTGAPQLVAASPGHLVIWDTDRASVVRRQSLDGWSLRVGGVITPNGRHLVFSAARSRGAFEARLLDVTSGSAVTLRPAGPQSGRFAVTEDSALLMRAARGDGDSQVQLHSWRLPSGELLSSRTIDDTDGYVVSLALSPRGDRFAAGFNRRTRENPNSPGPKGRILVGDSATGRVLATIDTPDLPPVLRFTSDGTQLYWGTNSDAEVHIADAISGNAIRSLVDASEPPVAFGGRGSVPGATQMIAVSPDWTHIATAGRMYPIAKLWRPADGTLLHRVALGGGATSIDISRDGTRLAAGTFDGQVSIWNIKEPAAPVQTFSIR